MNRFLVVNPEVKKIKEYDMHLYSVVDWARRISTSTASLKSKLELNFIEKRSGWVGLSMSSITGPFGLQDNALSTEPPTYKILDTKKHFCYELGQLSPRKCFLKKNMIRSKWSLSVLMSTVHTKCYKSFFTIKIISFQRLLCG